MRSLLADAVAELGLEPGQSHTDTVGDRVVKVTVQTAKAAAEEEPSEYADMVMLNIIPVYPPSPTAITVQARFSDSPMPMDPVVIDEWDRSK